MTNEKPTIQWVIERYHLEPNRAGFILCPVHEEREPSCHLDCKKNYWYCFGCGANGDSIGLIAAVTRQPVADVLRTFADKVPSWRQRRTVDPAPTQSTTVRRAYRALHNWMFGELARRLEGAPEWMVLRAVEYWGEQFTLVDEIIRLEQDLPKAAELLKGLAACCERGLAVEESCFWGWVNGELGLRACQEGMEVKVISGGVS